MRILALRHVSRRVSLTEDVDAVNRYCSQLFNQSSRTNFVVVPSSSLSNTSGHHANIFSAKFLPATNDSVIVSCAGDSEVRVFDISHGSLTGKRILEGEGGLLRKVYTCHNDRVKRIVVEEGNPWVFLSCSEDGE